MYTKKEVHLKNTNRASINDITDFGMISRLEILVVIGTEQRLWGASQWGSLCVWGSEHGGEVW